MVKCVEVIFPMVTHAQRRVSRATSCKQKWPRIKVGRDFRSDDDTSQSVLGFQAQLYTENS